MSVNRSNNKNLQFSRVREASDEKTEAYIKIVITK